MKCIYCQNVIKKKNTEYWFILWGQSSAAALLPLQFRCLCEPTQYTTWISQSFKHFFFLDKQMLNIFFFIGLAGVFALFLSDL